MASETQNSFIIKPVEASQIPDLICIGEETNLSRWSEQSYLHELDNKNSVMLCLLGENQAIIGFVVGRFVPAGSLNSALDAEIYNIAVIGTMQQKGFGQRLFDAFAAECREKQVETIWLEVRESNKNAIALYNKNGFVPIQTRPFFYENPRENAIVMKLILKY